MSNLSKDTNDTWDYLSGILESSNKDEDIASVESNNEITKPSTKSNLEKQIAIAASGDTPLSKVSQITVGKVHLHGFFKQVSARYTRSGLLVTDAIFSDDSGSVKVVWFKVKIAYYLRNNVEYELRGRFALNNGRLQINSPNIRPLMEGCKPFEKTGSKK